MQHIFALIAAVGVLTLPQAGAAAKAPIEISTCTLGDLYNPASVLGFGPPIPIRLLQLSFLDTDDTAATQVTFDVTHDGMHGIVTDRGIFSKGVLIEKVFDNFTGMYGTDWAACAVTAVTFADGRRWTAPGGGTTTNR
jgi:hypothetical protein